ncbi:hypothetical protein DYB36_005747 [Aphanomyces astaci]|uniref:START domain-containing protein n=1 Tax=Aphanomyces astaci TaxID=112090 RepID=A0A397BH58_APHAT|nr:hypothetical protein DYB36_005747 [Aphanomyces astaci]
MLHRRTNGPVTWIPISNSSSTSPHVQVFSGKKPGESSTVAYFCAVTQLQASLDDVARVFRTETTAKYREHAKTFAPDYLDCASLTNLVLPTETTPLHYIGVKWAAVESPTIFIKPRDFCFLECQDEFVDRRTGRRGWVHSMHSVSWGQVCPPMDKSHGLVRGSIYRSGYVFIESDRPNCLEVVHVLQVDMKGSVPSWVMSSIMKRRVMEVGRLQHYFRRVKPFSPSMLALTDKPKKSYALHCHACRTPVFSQRHHCRTCGHVTCKKCSADVVVDVADVGRTNMRVCHVEASATADEFWDDEPRAFKTDRGPRKQGRFQSADWFLSHRAALMANPFRPSVSLSCDAADSALMSDVAGASAEVHDEAMPGTTKFPDHYMRPSVSRRGPPLNQRVDGGGAAALQRSRQTRENHRLGESFGIEHFNPEDIMFHSLDRPSSNILMGHRTASAVRRDEWTFNSLLAVRPSSQYGMSYGSSSRLSDMSDLSMDAHSYQDGDCFAPMQMLEEGEFESSSMVGMDSTATWADEDLARERVAATRSSRGGGGKLLTPQPHPSQMHPHRHKNPTTRSHHAAYSLVSESLVCPTVHDRSLPPTPHAARPPAAAAAVVVPPPSSHAAAATTIPTSSCMGRMESGDKRQTAMHAGAARSGAVVEYSIKGAELDKLDALAATLAERLMRVDSMDKDTIRELSIALKMPLHKQREALKQAARILRGSHAASLAYVPPMEETASKATEASDDDDDDGGPESPIVGAVTLLRKLHQQCADHERKEASVGLHDVEVLLHAFAELVDPETPVYARENEDSHATFRVALRRASLVQRCLKAFNGTRSRSISSDPRL